MKIACSSGTKGMPRSARRLSSPDIEILLSRGPDEHPPTENVQVDMVNRLARTGVHIEHRAISLLVDIRLHRKFFGNLEHLADEWSVFRHQVIQCRNVLLGHDQEMDRSLRPKILECHDEVVFMHKVCGCIAFDNPAKKTRLLHGLNLALLGVLLCTTLLAGAKPLQHPTRT